MAYKLERLMGTRIMFADGTDTQRIAGRAVMLRCKPQATSWNYVGSDQIGPGSGQKNGWK